MHPLSQKIASLQRRLIWRRRGVAACWILATAVAAAIVLGLADYFLRFTDPGMRIIATAPDGRDSLGGLSLVVSTAAASAVSAHGRATSGNTLSAAS